MAPRGWVERRTTPTPQPARQPPNQIRRKPRRRRTTLAPRKPGARNQEANRPMMTKTEIGMLLMYAAGTDNRKVTPDAVQAWADALAPYVNIDDAKRAIAEHRATSDDYLMPVHINQAVKRYRADRIARAPYGDVPDGLDPRQTNAWLTQYRAGIG